MFPTVDTKNASAVASLVVEKFGAMYPGADLDFLRKFFVEIEKLFTGRQPDYSAVDLHYHDFEHTLQATVCLVLLLEGRHRAAVQPKLGPREFELAIAGVLLHDAGYLKLRSDIKGTGAKYAFCHVLRSCVFAASYLPTHGVNDLEVEAVLGAINCTGPAKEIGRLRFRRPVERVVGCALGTADYLGQMAASDYPDELEILYREFRESDEFTHVPIQRRAFKSAADLINRTPMFWKKFVLPKLESDFQAVYRFLARPFPNGPNPYLDAVERNLATIQRRISAPRRAPQEQTASQS
ncbi:MAG: hypothetical protein ABIZ49_12255 [Opitutaceae bacterium]